MSWNLMQIGGNRTDRVLDWAIRHIERTIEVDVGTLHREALGVAVVEWRSHWLPRTPLNHRGKMCHLVYQMLAYDNFLTIVERYRI